MYWTFKIRDGPTGHLAAAICIGQNIYCFGDMLNIRIEQASPMDYLDVYILNTQALRWSRMPVITDENGAPLHYPEVPSRGSGTAAVAYEDKIYIFCCPNATLYCFHPRTLGWSRPAVTGIIPEAHDGDSACIVGHCMYIFRYFSDGSNRTVPYLDFRTFEWRSLRIIDPLLSLVCPFKWRKPVSIEGRIYLIEGKFGGYAQIVHLDVNTGQWHRPSTSGNRPPRRLFHSLFVYNGLIYTFNNMILYSFDTKRNFWCAVSTHGVEPLTIWKYCFCVMKDTKMFFLGNIIFHGRDDCYQTRILDFQPSLRSLAILAVAQHKLNTSCLPRMLQEEVRNQTEGL